ncbi:D-sedoheptulose 7-phosphate isomerase [Methylohalomonas lacus]|uniref:D-sedoheptulose 7-phosphate isomerase n=1 Tax=Methylohalomonas lacus TaxID=398773 RepID=A0AAE3HI12_9GAMM|nr:SIS domain-containing protein [Methylohalomonas lacus]MCS3902240.1 D-sedoheptulose 7-phosphate isomerase [Methylohalomonas lacus]
MDAVSKVRQLFKDTIAVQTEASEQLAPGIVQAGDMLASALLGDHRILACGNGASAACAQHFTSLMVNRFEMERPGLPAFALTADSTTLTSIADDYQFADVFAKQIRALSSPGDILLAISVNGSASNLVHALDAAHDRKMRIILLSGQDGGRCSGLLEEEDLEIRVPSWVAARIQETHVTVIHSICDLIDRHLLGQED